MRTTIDLAEYLRRIANAIAQHTGRNLSQAVAKPMRLGLRSKVAEDDPPARTVHPQTG